MVKVYLIAFSNLQTIDRKIDKVNRQIKMHQFSRWRFRQPLAGSVKKTKYCFARNDEQIIEFYH